MPSRCIFFFSALRAWSTLLSRTRTCTRRSSCCVLELLCLDVPEPADPPPKRDRAGSRLVAHVAEPARKVHQSSAGHGSEVGDRRAAEDRGRQSTKPPGTSPAVSRSIHLRTDHSQTQTLR